jgi:hypothetical protein
MKSSQKLWNLFFISITLGASILLSAGISNLEFSFGEPFTFPRSTRSASGPPNFMTRGETLINVLLVLFAVLQFLLPIAVIYFLLSKEMRKNVVRALFSLLWIFALVILVRSGRYPFMPTDLDPIDSFPSSEIPVNEVEFITRPAQWLVVTVTISLALILATISVLIVRLIWNRTRRRQSPLHLLVEEAQEAMEALDAGAGLRNTVIRCYYEMSRILSEQRGIQRTQAMTPREFQRELVKIGLPRDDVGELTRLFEMVRYGTKDPGEIEEQVAIQSLASIVEAVKVTP